MVDTCGNVVFIRGFSRFFARGMKLLFYFRQVLLCNR